MASVPGPWKHAAFPVTGPPLVTLLLQLRFQRVLYCCKPYALNDAVVLPSTGAEAHPLGG